MISKVTIIAWFLSMLSLSISLMSLGMSYKRLMIKRKYIDRCQAVFWLIAAILCFYLCVS